MIRRQTTLRHPRKEILWDEIDKVEDIEELKWWIGASSPFVIHGYVREDETGYMRGATVTIRDEEAYSDWIMWLKLNWRLPENIVEDCNTEQSWAPAVDYVDMMGEYDLTKKELSVMYQRYIDAGHYISWYRLIREEFYRLRDDGVIVNDADYYTWLKDNDREDPRDFLTNARVIPV